MYFSSRRRTARLSKRPRLFVEELETRVLLVSEIEPNNSLAVATGFTRSGEVLLGEISTSSDTDYFVTNLQQGVTLKILPHESNGYTSPAIEVLDSQGNVRTRSLDNHDLYYMVPANGNYGIRLTGQNTFGQFVGPYSIRVQVDAYQGVRESEPNDSAGTADALGGSNNFSGSLASAADVDYFSFVAQAGSGVAVKLANRPALNPAVRLFDSSGALVASDRSGIGLHATLTTSGTYSISLRGDNAAGNVTGQYVGNLQIVPIYPTAEREANNDFSTAAAWSIGRFVVPSALLGTSQSLTTRGLTGSYVNTGLGWYAPQDDWRQTQTGLRTRVDPLIRFPSADWGLRASVGITGGPSDADWDNFSVQWDGFIRIVRPGTRLFTASDDSSRMWIDINGDGLYGSLGPEFVNNNWGGAQGTTAGPASVPLDTGTYRIRMQYWAGGGPDEMFLLWDDYTNSAGIVDSALWQTRSEIIGTISSVNDVDVFAIDLSTTHDYDIRLETVPAYLGVQDRVLSLYNEWGQLVTSTDSGVLLLYRNDLSFHSGRHYLTVQAGGEAGVGGYALYNFIGGEYPKQRDVPLYYQDYSGLTPAAQSKIPQLVGFFESRFDPYHVDVTLTSPPAGTERSEYRLVDDPVPGGCGGVGGGWRGVRRLSGSASVRCGSGGWNSLAGFWNGFAPMAIWHEVGHASTLPHAWHPLSPMATGGYDGQGDIYPPGTFFPIGVDPWVSIPALLNERNRLDWVLQAGRIVAEVESPGVSGAQELDPFFAEMSRDAEPRNDKVVVVGRIDSTGDVDRFRFTAAAGETFFLDIDAAEFQIPLNAVVELYDPSGNLIATSDDALDRDSGLDSTDPFLVHQFAASGKYEVRVSGRLNTTGNYRLKLTPQRALDRDGPRVLATWPDGGSAVDGTRQITFWLNDELDPATLTTQNIVVTGAATGVRAGAAFFDPLDATLTWQAASPLPPDTYTVRLLGSASGIKDLQGNALDGETDGTLSWPEVSGNAVPGGDFVTTFRITAADVTPAAVTSSTYRRHPHNRGQFTLNFSDELDAFDLVNKGLILHGAGPDSAFATADDTRGPLDLLYTRLDALNGPYVVAYSRGIPDPGRYRVEGNFLDAAGRTVNVATELTVTTPESAPREASLVPAVPSSALGTNPSLSTNGLVGTYFNSSFRFYQPQDDWRVTRTQFLAGQRTDPEIYFLTRGWGDRQETGVTGGTEPAGDWWTFSVQWDGYIRVDSAGTVLHTFSDDGSRLWVDINRDGDFSDAGEFLDNGWGTAHGVTMSPDSSPLAPGVYPIRIQYEQGLGDHEMRLHWFVPNVTVTEQTYQHGPSVVDSNVQPNAVVTAKPGRIDVTFNGEINTASLTSTNFRLRFSPDPVFFDGNDSFVVDADNAIAWDPISHRATLQPASPLANGYYLIELNGQAGGIVDRSGRLLDGEYLDGNIAGSTQASLWRDAPSGDGKRGGDYRAYFIVNAMPTTPTQPDLLPESDTGTSDTDNITSRADATIEIIETDPEATVEVLVGGTLAGSATRLSGATFRYSFAPGQLQEGANVVTARASGANGLSPNSPPVTIVLDRVAPSPPTIPDLATASDTGVSSTDNITNDNRPLLTGSAEPGSMISLFSDFAGLLGTTAANAAGVWSLASSILADGSHSITAQAKDAAGNLGVSSTALSVTIDTTPPAEVPSTPDLVDASDSGSSASDNITNVIAPTITGTAPAGSFVTLADGQTVRGTTSADASGVWSFTSPALGQGLHAITARAMDIAGNLGPASATLPVTIDTTVAAPAALDLSAASDSGSSSSDNRTNITTLTITGTAEPLSSVAVSSDIVGALGEAFADAAGNWVVTSTVLVDGLHRVTARAIDLAGNASGSSAALSIRIDTQAPAAPALPDLAASRDSGASNSDNVTNFRSPTFTGMAEASIRVSVISDIAGVLGTVTVAANGGWSFTGGNLADGEHQITVEATDTAGNTSNASPALTVVIDTTRPPTPSNPDLDAISDTGISNSDNITQNNSPTVRGTAEPGSTVTLFLNGSALRTAAVDGAGLWISVAPVLPDGVYRVNVGATDRAGNDSPASPILLLTVDTTIVAPAAPVLDPASDTGLSSSDQITSITTPTVSGTAEPGSSVTVFDGNLPLPTADVDATGRWTAVSPVLTDGDHSISVQATDPAGNTSAMSAVLNIQIDTQPPGAPARPDLDAARDSGRSNSDDYTNDSTPDLSGTAEPDGRIEMFDGTTSLGTTATDGNGKWTFRPPVPLTDGLHSLKVVESDRAGNASGESDSLDITIDTMAPPLTGKPMLDPASDTGASNTDGKTNDTTPTLHGLAEPLSKIELFDAAIAGLLGEADADFAGFWTFTVPSDKALTQEGEHGITARTTDRADNASPVSLPLALTIDTQGPTITSVRLVPGIRGRVSEIALRFNEELDSAGNLADLRNYQLMLRRKGIRLASAIPDPDTRGVRLMLRKPIAATKLTPAVLHVSGALAVVDRISNPFDGDADGQPGGDFERRLSDATL